MRKLVFVTHSLGSGGAERVLCLLAGYFSNSYDVSIVTLQDGESFYPIDERVRVVSLPTLPRPTPFHALINSCRRLFGLRSCFKTLKPDLVVSFLTTPNIYCLIASVGLALPVIVSERTHPRYMPLSLFWKSIRRMVYPMASSLVVQTSDIQVCYEAYNRDIQVIFNPISLFSDSTYSPKNRILSVGRLSFEKGFKGLLDAFSRLPQETLETWELVICGDGPDRQMLESYAQELGVGNRVVFKGRVQAIQEEYAQASIFVLNSLFEGFPNVLCEAMSCGIACISTDCPSGPSDIIRDGENGLLIEVNDTTALHESMVKLIRSPQLRSELGTQGTCIRDELALDKIGEQWAILVESKL